MDEEKKRETVAEREAQRSAQSVAAKERAAEKKRLRATALEKRDSLTAQQRKRYSDSIIKNLTGLSCYQDADAVLTYISFRSEVDTIPLIEQALAGGKAVFAPKVTGKEMVFYRIFSLDDLSAGYRRILEPAGGQSIEAWMDDWTSQFPHILICLPGAAFDRKRHRIGYGGGFYDRYLSKFLLKMEVTTAALAYDCQIFDKIPWEAHDICPARIITQTSII